jgi:MYXO-CTERM domain-containing protein
MRCLSALAMLLSFLASTAWSQTPFFPFEDTFDGPLDDDAPVTWLSGGFPVTITHTDGDLVLSLPTQLDGFALGLTVISKDGELVLDGDTSARTVFRVSDPNAFGSIYTRSQAGFPGSVGVPEGGDGGAYFGNIAGNGTIQVGSFTNPDGILNLETTLDATTRDVVFQLDTFGNTVTASAWYADEPKPEFPPSITFTDDVARPPGFYGVSFGGFGDAATDVSATFRSFQIVPEPSTMSLAALGLGILGLLGLRRRRLFA